MSEAIRIHPQNRKILEYKGKPVVLVCATEHYGAVINRPFDSEAYFRECKDKKQNYTRLFLLFRELQTHNNPFSTCKPETPDYISPFRRTGPGNACDGLPKYNLDVWNEEFFERLHSFMELANKNDVIVEVVLFSCSYFQHLFELIPLCGKNNINGTEDIDFNVALSMKAPKLFEYQKKYVSKIVTELNKYPNFFFEICNEPVCFSPELVTNQEINDWEDELIRFVRGLEKDLPNQHLIAAEESWEWHHREGHVKVGTAYNFQMEADIVNIHPLEDIRYENHSYNMGEFMSKSLHLGEYRAFCLDTYKEGKVLNMDEDNVASEYREYEGWIIHRKRAWTTVMCGAHYDYIDFSIQTACPAGTPESRKYIRSWFKHLQSYLETMDLAACRPLNDCVAEAPEHTISSVMGVDGREYHVYIADARETDDPEYGGKTLGRLVLDTTPGEYTASVYSPESGQFSIGIDITGGKGTEVILPPFIHDVLIRLKKKD